jgi:hypothetical protein
MHTKLVYLATYCLSQLLVCLQQINNKNLNSECVIYCLIYYSLPLFLLPYIKTILTDATLYCQTLTIRCPQGEFTSIPQSKTRAMGAVFKNQQVFLLIQRSFKCASWVSALLKSETKYDVYLDIFEPFQEDLSVFSTWRYFWENDPTLRKLIHIALLSNTLLVQWRLDWDNLSVCYRTGRRAGWG